MLFETKERIKEYITIISVTIAAAVVAVCAVAWIASNFSDHGSCVRAQVADKTHPMSEADAHLECGRWLNRK